MASLDFRQILNWMEGFGFKEVLLPFLLIFTIVFAVMQTIKLFGQKSKNLNAMVSLIISALSVVPHVTGRGPDIVAVINKALPDISVFMVAFISLLLILGVFGGEIHIIGTPISGWMVFFCILLVAYTFISPIPGVCNLPVLSLLCNLITPENRNALIAILVFALLIWFITKEELSAADKKEIADMRRKKGRYGLTDYFRWFNPPKPPEG